MTKFQLTILALATSALAACGGGGGGGGGGGLPFAALATAPSTPAATATPPPTTTTTTTPVETVTGPSAPADTEETAAVALLNKERLTCGFGALVRNAQLDAAAKGHVNWLLVNNYSGHNQVSGTTGFTGVDPSDRILAAGYAVDQFQDLSTEISGRAKAVGFGEVAVRGLLSAPYHLRGLMAGQRDVGVSVMSSDDAGTTSKLARVIAQFDLANTASAGVQSLAVGTVHSYPCQGTTGTFTTLLNETPNPLPGRDLSTSPIGQPVYLVGDSGKVLVISDALMQEKVTGNTITLLPSLTGANDPNHELQTNEAIVMPGVPLKASTEYTVSINGTNDGVSFTKTFGFTTGSVADATSSNP